MKPKVKAPRLINKGTVYDLDGRMRRITRQIASGELGEVTDAVVLVKVKEGQGQCVQMYHFGGGHVETCHWMLQSGINRITP